MNLPLMYASSFGATLLAAIVGSLASIEAGPFYGALAKPTWAPSAGVFGPVWSLLYLMIAAAGGLALSAANANGRVLAALFFAQLVLNALWSWTFFKWESGPGSMFTITVLWLAIALTTIEFFKVSQIAGLLMIPYLLWVAFAAILNAAMWRMNLGAL